MKDDEKHKDRRNGERVLYRPGMLKSKEPKHEGITKDHVPCEDLTALDLNDHPESSFQVSAEDEAARFEEIEVIMSIYPDLFFQDSPTRIILSFEKSIRLTVNLCHDYPSRSPPSFELSGPSLSPQERLFLTNSLNETYINNLGMPVLFMWITVINDFLQNSEHAEKQEELSETVEIIEQPRPTEPLLQIFHGEVFTDRKSHFQAHLCRISTKEQVPRVIRQLKSNNKIARATHNIWAYRIKQLKEGKEFSLHDCFDDGEDGASPKMLDIMEKMKVENTMVVVTRWYGGIHLGPDRFRIINNLTRDIITQCDAE